MSDIFTVLLPFIVLGGVIFLSLVMESFGFGRKYIAPITIIGSLISLFLIILGINSTEIYLFGDPANLLDISSSGSLLTRTI